MFSEDPKVWAAPDGIKPDTPPLTLYENGRTHQRYVLNEAGRIDGQYEEFYDDEAGTLKHRVTYVDGVMHGPEELYYPNGVLFQARASVDGWYDGIEERFYNTGVLRSRFGWKKGAMVGFIQHFHESGIMKSLEFRDDEGKRDMCGYSFDAASHVTRLAVWSKGSLHLEQLYSENGATVSEKRFGPRDARSNCVAM
mmetsp:Transcript_49991/g.99288  ORF Transcript_49991/g.99288 Transcript_49991/m.99288 type:complete len:196 (-) Transcript_49991:56-643(-)|eukprot:CAMPEP_0172682198 /NCGR_PEP_ID=MMETSP1074-20121228/17998_1 /TAXON_ID=2916 /ORGANISM="Ceratium fusus, Strain PA161109" /LENGTH=195 /DNA_ID=CAMNT_0013500837 /DNA_START=21 /DNA_END=608 /DNA_ORIENTATION=-